MSWYFPKGKPPTAANTPSFNPSLPPDLHTIPGYGFAQRPSKANYVLPELVTLADKERVERALNALPGIFSINVHMGTKKVSIAYASHMLHTTSIHQVLIGAGFNNILKT